MLGDKGQGALEYLLILAAVLAIAVIVILVAHQVSTPAQQSALINEDKYSCAQAGIELVNYNSLPEQGHVVWVKYRDQQYPCYYGGVVSKSEWYYIDENTEPEVVCNIHLSNGKEVQLGPIKGYTAYRRGFVICDSTLQTVCYYGQKPKTGCSSGMTIW